MGRRLIAILTALIFLAPSSAGAWGFEVHRRLTARVLDGLPATIRPFFAADRAFVITHSIDPDLWRIVGLRGVLGSEDPNHFLNIDGLDEPPPFAGVPRDREAFVLRYGAARAERAGRVPWRVEEIYRKLVAAFKELGTRPSANNATNVRYLTAALAHYVEDSFVPFHASANYDGQLTHQIGIHSRFENELVLRNWDGWQFPAVATRSIGAPKDFIFDTLVESASFVQPVLDADRAAAKGTTTFDDGYYARFAAGAGAIAQSRVIGAANGVATVIVAAWTEAGRPLLIAR